MSYGDRRDIMAVCPRARSSMGVILLIVSYIMQWREGVKRFNKIVIHRR